MKKLPIWARIALIFSIVIFSLGAILGVAILIIRAPADGYYKASQKAFVIPGLSDGLVQQGFHYDQNLDTFLVSGYMTDKSSSRIYFVDGTTYELEKYVTLNKADGKIYKGHAGGIAVYNNFIYMAGGSDGCIYVFSTDQAINAENGSSITAIGTIPLAVSDTDYLGTAFVTVYGDRLITGEFYRTGDYPTPDSHKFNTPNGDFNQALALEYELSPLAPLGVIAQPVKAYTLPDQVQGLNIHDGKIYLSTSWGVSSSHILEYSESNLSKDGSLSLLGYTTPLYHLDSASLLRDLVLPPMAEEIVFKDGFLFVMNESASKKYIFGNLTGGKWCYKTDLSKM